MARPVDYPPGVVTLHATAPSRPEAPPQSAPRTRIITTALSLFAQHGVSGTSLQMIADVIGVTKAAVYHQFKTKDEIVLAVAESELPTMEAALAAAEAAESRAKAREVLLGYLIDLAVTHRSLVGLLQTDPVMARLLADHESFQKLIQRMYVLLIADDPDPDAWVQVAMLSAAIGGAVMHPLMTELDDDALRLQLRHFTRNLVQIPR
jgi:AcrR family transcriptional regulator